MAVEKKEVHCHGGKGVFVHFFAIQGDGYCNLRDGQRVEFTQNKDQRSPVTNVIILI
ncbi:MAG: cold-shock protein [Chloroflexi bacterium]|nr:cold-shock protein [Chloroflexota bacterium]